MVKTGPGGFKVLLIATPESPIVDAMLKTLSIPAYRTTLGAVRDFARGIAAQSKRRRDLLC
jgi:hypothetical protein